MPETQKQLRKSKPKTFDSVQLETTETSNEDVILAARAGGRSAEPINAISLQSTEPANADSGQFRFFEHAQSALSANQY